MRKIIIIRLPIQAEDNSLNSIAKAYKKELRRYYDVIVILGENNTDKTTFEIIG